MPICKENNDQVKQAFSASIAHGDLCPFCFNDAMDYIADHGRGLSSIKWACPHREKKAVIRIETTREY